MISTDDFSQLAYHALPFVLNVVTEMGLGLFLKTDGRNCN